MKSPSNKTFKGYGGFTLLEVMIALAIVGGLLLTLIQTLNYQLTIAERHKAVVVSTDLAKEKLYSVEKNLLAGKGRFPEPFSDYSYDAVVRDSSFPGMTEIEVTVGDGKESVTLSELVRKKVQ